MKEIPLSEYYQLKRISIRDLTAFFAFLAGWVGSAAFAWPYLVVGWETGHFTRGVFNFLVVAFGTATLAGIAGLWLGSVAGAAWERSHRHRREVRDAARVHDDNVTTESPPPVRRSNSDVHAPLNIRFETGTVTGTAFLALAQRVWPRSYDDALVAKALDETINIGAWDDTRLVGTVRVLTDGYLFATIPEILVDPEYQRRGIGRELMRLAVAAAPRGAVFFGAQPESVGFFERIGAELGPTGFVMRRPKL